MPDDIKQRLQDSANKCVKAYEVWAGDKKNSGVRESLQEAIHEMRKITSRLEIELAVSERNQMTQKPMPIPQNRNAKGRHQKAGDGEDGNDGNKAENSQNEKPKKKVVLNKRSEQNNGNDGE